MLENLQNDTSDNAEIVAAAFQAPKDIRIDIQTSLYYCTVGQNDFKLDYFVASPAMVLREEGYAACLNVRTDFDLSGQKSHSTRTSQNRAYHTCQTASGSCGRHVERFQCTVDLPPNTTSSNSEGGLGNKGNFFHPSHVNCDALICA